MAMSFPLPIQEIESGGVNVPVTKVNRFGAFDPSASVGALRYEAPLDLGSSLETTVAPPWKHSL